ncbi:MAG: LamG domain-containing protein [Armatimonadota bacterium]
MRTILPALVVLVIAGGIAIAAPDGLLFHVSFDHDHRPDYAAGPTTTDAQAAITDNGGGQEGEALIAHGGFHGIEPFLSPWYLTAGNIDRQQGTIELWINPGEGLFDDPEDRRIYIHWWVERDRHLAPKVFRIDTRGGNLRVFEQDVADGDYVSHVQTPVDWQPGEWHHVAYTWGGGERVVYIDGEEVNRADPGRGLPTLGYFFRIGAGNWGLGYAEALVDEVRIWDRALTPDEFEGLQ